MKGLTLLEVLISLALMSTMAIAALPLLRTANESLDRHRGSGTKFHGLQEHIDAYDPQELLESGLDSRDEGGFEVEVLKALDVDGNEDSPTHVWLHFRAEGFETVRWVSWTPSPPEDGDEPPSEDSR